MTALYLKWLTADGTGPHQGVRYPARNRWTKPEAPELCRSGWHACRWEDAIGHINARLWVCELAGEIIEGADKVAATRLRLVGRTPIDDRTLRLFAADCAEDVLPVFDRVRPNDDRPRLAIAAARAFADGQIDRAARAAAGDAARAAAGDAAGDASRAAAGAAAGAAAWAAAGAAAGDAAWAAAWAAARDAAWDAAWAAARDAAWAAAWAAARAAQTRRLLTEYAQLDLAIFAHKAST